MVKGAVRGQGSYGCRPWPNNELCLTQSAETTSRDDGRDDQGGDGRDGQGDDGRDGQGGDGRDDHGGDGGRVHAGPGRPYAGLFE